MITAPEAIGRLLEGNRRFVSGATKGSSLSSQARREELVSGQEPFAIILGCSDSRVPVEMVFDQGLGDLFVVRVAGNIVTASLVGSIEFGVKLSGAPLVVVLGHSGCGAVQATLEEMDNPTENLSPNLRSISDCICPSIETTFKAEPRPGREELLRAAIRANTLNSIFQLQNESKILAKMIQDEKLQVVGAEYSQATGVVEFFDDLPR